MQKILEKENGVRKFKNIAVPVAKIDKFERKFRNIVIARAEITQKIITSPGRTECRKGSRQFIAKTQSTVGNRSFICRI